MPTQAFVIETLEDLVISQRSATLGGHRGLDYIPGQTLLGACAARLYQALGTASYAVFHSGAVRFGNAYCLDPGGQPAWPMPLCWHQAKGGRVARPTADPVRSALVSQQIYNMQWRTELPDRAQPKQLREGYVSAQGAWLKPKLSMRMKTAIEPGTGRAAEAQFFGYDALHRGTRLGGWIDADDGIDAALFERIILALTGPVLLGRSRSAEYGRARFEPVESPAGSPTPGPARGTSATLWLLSDLALQDEHGQPSLEPSPMHLLGLAGGRVDWDKTFIRTRRYAPWNGKRGTPDLERWVIQQGSVIRLDLDQAADHDRLRAHCQAGLGLYRECGLGRVWVDPWLLEPEQPTFAPADAARPEDAVIATAAPAVDPRAQDPLILWLRSQVDGEGSRERIEREARRLASAFQERLIQARRELGVANDALFGPSRSQWGRVLETARSEPGARLLTALFEGIGGREAVIKETATGWQELFFDRHRSRRTSLASWLRSALDRWIAEDARPSGSTRDLPRLVQRLAHCCRTDTETRPQ